MEVGVDINVRLVIDARAEHATAYRIPAILDTFFCLLDSLTLQRCRVDVHRFRQTNLESLRSLPDSLQPTLDLRTVLFVVLEDLPAVLVADRLPYFGSAAVVAELVLILDLVGSMPSS